RDWGGIRFMDGRVVASLAEEGSALALTSVLDAFDDPSFVVDRSGMLLAANQPGRTYLGWKTLEKREANVDLVNKLFEGGWPTAASELENGKAFFEVELLGQAKIARIRPVVGSDWFVLRLTEKDIPQDGATQLTVQELLQEREITYRNLLAAYLKLQEVNRQKTVFLASAAHELKTPLA